MTSCRHPDMRGSSDWPRKLWPSSYWLPQTEFTGCDEEFYELKAGDQVDILVRNDGKTKVIKG